jgi:hypothetical protein
MNYEDILLYITPVSDLDEKTAAFTRSTNPRIMSSHRRTWIRVVRLYTLPLLDYHSLLNNAA